jgi:hypothetical protein
MVETKCFAKRKVIEAERIIKLIRNLLMFKKLKIHNYKILIKNTRKKGIELMQKELVICIIIVILIIVGNVITHNNTKTAVAEINGNLQNVSNKIWQNKEIKEIEDAISTSKQIWDEKTKTLAYYIEHDELEKASSELTKLKADVETENYDFAIENLDNCVFILEHIKDKSALKIVNIF